jgi:glycosyltransferase involved in cell wall biosynthesis
MSRRVVIGVTARPAVNVIVGHCDALHRDGWDVHVVTGEPLEPRLLPGISTHVIPTQRGPALFSDMRSWRTWRTLISRLQPDAVVAATPKTSLLALTAAQSLGIRHRIWWAWGMHSDDCSSRFTTRRAERVTGASASTVVAASASLAESIRSRRYHRTPIVLGPGSIAGVDLDALNPTSLSTDSPPTAVYIGRLSRAKGLADLHHVWRQVLAKLPTARLLVAGQPDALDAADSALRSLAALPGVAMLGWVHDIPALLNSAHVLIHPSHREGFPAVVLEAAACEIPAVVWDVVGSRDAVVSGETGVVVARGDINGFAGSVVDLLVDPQHRHHLGRAARSRVQTHFNRTHVEERFLEFLNSTVAVSVPPRRVDKSRVPPEVSLSEPARFTGQPV